MDPLRKFRYSLIPLFVLIGSGTASYMVIEGWSAFASLYDNYHPDNRWLQGGSFSLLRRQGVHHPVDNFGAGTIAYTIGTLIQFMVEGQLRTLLGRKKVEITIAAQVLRDADIRKNLGIIIVSINKRNGQPIFNPGPETRMAAGEILISLGKPPAIKNSEEIASGQVRHAG